MRVFILAILLAFFNHSVYAQAPTDFTEKGVIEKLMENKFFRENALKRVIQQRCSRYMKSFIEQQSCNFAVHDMIRSLDFDILFFGDVKEEDHWETGSFVFVAFKENFYKLLELTTIQTYLLGINEAFYGFFNDNFSFNLWDYTLKYFKNNEDIAAHVIAILFQDTSPLKLHIEYVLQKEKNPSKYMSKNLKILSEVIDNFNFAADTDIKRYKAAIFPKHLLSNRNGSLYHFYVPMYLSVKLQKKGYSKRYSSIGAFMLTLTYEMVSSNPKSWKTYIWNDPENVTSSWKVQDIYQGYSGAMMGTKQTQKMKNFETAKSYYKQSTKKGTQYLLSF